MGEALITRRGGSGAAFRIKYYSSSITGTEKEGTIGIVTTTPATSVVISPLEPETPAAGMIWINVGVASAYPVSIGKKQVVTICPLKVMQYESGAWVQKTAKNYSGGAWRDWVKIIISGGVAAVAMTAKAVDWSGYAIATAPTVATDDSATRLYEKGVSGVGYHAGIYECDTPIDLTPFNKCKITYKTQGNDARAKLMARTSTSTTSGTLADITNSAAYTTAEIDISAMNDEQYFSIAFGDFGTSGSYIWIRSLTLEP